MGAPGGGPRRSVGDAVGDGMYCSCALSHAAALGPLEARKAPGQGAAAMTQARGSPTSKPGSLPPPSAPTATKGGLWYTFCLHIHAATRWPLAAKSSGHGPMTQGVVQEGRTCMGRMHWTKQRSALGTACWSMSEGRPPLPHHSHTTQGSCSRLPHVLTCTPAQDRAKQDHLRCMRCMHSPALHATTPLSSPLQPVDLP